MKIVELLKLGQNWLDLLQNACISIKDCRFIAMYEEYEKMVSQGEKTTFAVTVLSRKYGISERKVYYLLKKFGQDCTPGAV